MDETRFPIYRHSANGLNWYRVESGTEFTEVQKVGSRYVAHRVKAVIYPEKVRVMELIAADDGHVVACEAEAFETHLALCSDPG